jgi:hypothetical protein
LKEVFVPSNAQISIQAYTENEDSGKYDIMRRNKQMEICEFPENSKLSF